MFRNRVGTVEMTFEMTAHITKGQKITHSNAKPDVHTVEELIPCMIRASTITQYLGASINMISQQSRVNKPMINGNL